VVCHAFRGVSFTSKISFQAIISCVKGFIDANPDTLPIILSLENHCSPSFQEIMAVILKDTLGENLYISESTGHWPSPLELVGKVILKGMRSQENNDNDLISLAQTFSWTTTAESVPGNPRRPQSAHGLSSMLFLNGVNFSCFSTSLDLPYADMHSFNEEKFLKILNENPANVTQWKEFNSQHLTRWVSHYLLVDSLC
jgi:phosphatidylinositol phospholipase C delta